MVPAGIVMLSLGQALRYAITMQAQADETSVRGLADAASNVSDLRDMLAGRTELTYQSEARRTWRLSRRKCGNISSQCVHQVSRTPRPLRATLRLCTGSAVCAYMQLPTTAGMHQAELVVRCARTAPTVRSLLLLSSLLSSASVRTPTMPPATPCGWGTAPAFQSASACRRRLLTRECVC